MSNQHKVTWRRMPIQYVKFATPLPSSVIGWFIAWLRLVFVCVASYVWCKKLLHVTLDWEARGKDKHVFSALENPCGSHWTQRPAGEIMRGYPTPGSQSTAARTPRGAAAWRYFRQSRVKTFLNSGTVDWRICGQVSRPWDTSITGTSWTLWDQENTTSTSLLCWLTEVHVVLGLKTETTLTLTSRWILAFILVAKFWQSFLLKRKWKQRRTKYNYPVVRVIAKGFSLPVAWPVLLCWL